MKDATEILKEYNIKKPYEKVMEDIQYCIESAAASGKRKIEYRWPFAYNPSLYNEVKFDLEYVYHYQVFDGNSGDLWNKDTLYISW